MHANIEKPTDVRIALITTPSGEKSIEIARALTESKLCACVNILPAVRSFYWWEGKVCDENESLLVVKTTAEGAAFLAEKLAQIHPYEVPELLILSPEASLAPYAEWVQKSVIT